MGSTWLCVPWHQRGAPCSDPPSSTRARPAVRSSLPRPARSPELGFQPSPCPTAPRSLLREQGLPTPRPGARTPGGWEGCARSAHPASGAAAAAAAGGPPAALSGSRAPGSAPAAAAGARAPPGAGPAAAALRTPAAGRRRQQLPPRCPSSYCSEGSSRCSLGKRSLPLARNRLPTFHRSARAERKSDAYFLLVVDGKGN